MGSTLHGHRLRSRLGCYTSGESSGEEERRLRIWAHLNMIHDLVSELALISANDARWQGPQVNLRREVTVVFHPLPKCGTLADADLSKIEETAYPELVREAMAQVESAMRDVWKDVRRWSWFRRRPVVSRVDIPGVSQSERITPASA